ncbi:GAF domain-containing protein [Halobaculum sp. WSA2]|uniref:histidine kinase n=1 Tax=Halobaculum saliterrae TaxID=2073113 RepID=A0A6B0SWG9_9EURY|nr:GAF domain-containing protein [Halobaculum saliterrae]MXR40592.1 GAF domain-containing protein [Halobaculum saliterrae]
MADQVRVLHVDPDPESAAPIVGSLERAGRVSTETVGDAETALDRLASTAVDCVVAEYALQDRTGIDLLERVRVDRPLLPFVLHTDEDGDALASRAFAAGATDCLSTDADADRRDRVVDRVVAAVERFRAAGGSAATERPHGVARGVGEALLRATARADALERVCELLVDGGPFSSAGVATLEDDGDDAALEHLTLEEHHTSATPEDSTEPEEYEGTLGSVASALAREALEADGVVVRSDRRREGDAAADESDERERGGSSGRPPNGGWPGGDEHPFDGDEVAAVPIASADTVHGALVVTADAGNVIDRSGRELLERVGNDTAHALDSFETEERLREEADRRRALFSNAPNSVIEGEVLDEGETHRIRSVNEAFEETFGYDPNEAVGSDIADVVVPPERVDDHRRLRSQIAEGESILAEVVRETADGEREFLLSGIPWGSDGDRADGWYVWHVDISERKRRANAIEELHDATGALVEAETADEVGEITADALRDVLDLPYNGVHLYDDRVDGLVPVAWTSETEEVVGTPPTIAPGEGIAGRTYEAGEPRVYGDISDASEPYNPETAIRSQMALPLADHGVLLVGSPERDAFDDLDVSMARTLAEHATAVLHRIEREHVLEELQDRTRRLMQAATPEAIAEVAVETANEVLGAQLSGVHFVRDGGRRLELAAHADSVETSFDELPVYERNSENDPAAAVVWDAFDSGEPRYIDDIRTRERLAAETPSRSVIVYPLDGHGVFIVSSTEPNAFDEPDKTFSEVLATAVVAALDRIEREQELRRRNEQLDEFAGLVSHDLRNPLNVAQGRLVLAREETDSDHLDSAASAIDRAISLLEESLAIARRGHDDGDVELVDLASAVADSWAHTDTAGAELVVDTDRTVAADPSRLKQLLENLIRNAVKHGGDDVRVAVGDVPGGFYVADDGPGIPEAERETVFDIGHTTDDESTGYGLYIVREIARAHGWAVEVSESEDGGARFDVTGVDDDER